LKEYIEMNDDKKLRFTEEVIQQMPEHARDWLRTLHPENRELMEHRLNLIGIENFAETFDYQKEDFEFYKTF